MDARDERIARNEALLREVNDRIHDVGGRFQVLAGNGELGFRCECGRPECDAFVQLTVSDYERVRSDNDRFVIVPGHEDAAIERIVERSTGYLVVDKRPEAEPFVGADGEPNSGR